MFIPYVLYWVAMAYVPYVRLCSSRRSFGAEAPSRATTSQTCRRRVSSCRPIHGWDTPRHPCTPSMSTPCTPPIRPSVHHIRPSCIRSCAANCSGNGLTGSCADLGELSFAGAFELLEGINDIKARDAKPWSRVFTKRMANGTKVCLSCASNIDALFYPPKYTSSARPLPAT